MKSSLNRMKRRIATLLSVMLLFGQVPIPATAENEPVIMETSAFTEEGKSITLNIRVKTMMATPKFWNTQNIAHKT